MSTGKKNYMQSILMRACHELTMCNDNMFVGLGKELVMFLLFIQDINTLYILYMIKDTKCSYMNLPDYLIT